MKEDIRFDNLVIIPALNVRNLASHEVRQLEKYLQLSLISCANVIGKKFFSHAQQVQISLTFCADTKIKTLNRNYRGKNKATDVLSFPLYTDLRKIRGAKKTQILALGDIVISVPYAKRQAKSFGLSLKEEVLHLFVHGLLHLLGYDHEISPSEEKKMQKLEDKILLESKKILSGRRSGK